MHNQTQKCSLALSILIVLGGCGGGSGSEQLPNDALIEDPAPEFSVPGEYGCEGCPDSDITQFSVNTDDSFQTFTDTVRNAAGDGEFYVLSDTGSTNAGRIETSENGVFSFTTPLFCGRQIVKCVWSNETGSYVLVSEVTRDDCTDSDIQVTLTWDDLGDDFDIHLVKPGGSYRDRESDCYFGSCKTSSVTSSLDWGVVNDLSDNPSLDVDNLGSFGPENIFLNRPEDGRYHVFVEHYGNGDPLADGSVVFNIRGETRMVATVEDLEPDFVWSVGTIDWPSGIVTLDGTVHDCSFSCDLPESIDAQESSVAYFK